MVRAAVLRLAPVALLIALGGCGSSSADPADDRTEGYASSDGDASSEPAEFDEDAARTDAEQEVAEEGYSGPCTSDCSGRDAGFNWAAEGHEDGGVSDSQSFDEGQEAYEEAVEERIDEKREQFEADHPDSE